MSYWNDIKLMFRGVDIAIMREHAPESKRMKLDELEDVTSNMRTIYSFVSASVGMMPPPPYRAWSEDMIGAFLDWGSTGSLRTDPELVARTKPFLALSRYLTGFDELTDAELANKHLLRLEARAKAAGDAPDPKDPNAFRNEDLQTLIERHGSLGEQEFVDQILGQERYARIARVIILLWYTAAFLENGFAVDSGSAQDNQYVQGLVWQAIEAHPMGYAAEGTTYWKEAPEPDGTGSGLGVAKDWRP